MICTDAENSHSHMSSAQAHTPGLRTEEGEGDIVENLETAPEQFGGIQEDMEKQINMPMSV